MKHIVRYLFCIFSIIAFIKCNDSGTGTTTQDTTSVTPDSVTQPIITEGGLRDSLATGATDTSAKKDTIKK